MRIQYRKIAAHNSNLYRAIRLESLKRFPERFCSKYEEERQKSVLSFETFIQEELNNKFVIGAFSDKELLGIAAFYQLAPESNIGDIVQMYVRPEFQGHNIGLELVEKTKEEAFKVPSINRIELDIISLPNDKLAAFYNKAGFEFLDQQAETSSCEPTSCLKLIRMGFDKR